MNKVKKFLASVLASALVATLFSIPAFAEGEEGTEGVPASYSSSYTVKLSGGNHATVSGSNPYVWSNVAPGTQLSVDDISVTVDAAVASKYYVKGIRKASVNNAYVGQFENVTASEVVNVDGTSTGVYRLAGALPAVHEDADYVVAFGIKGERVQYTVLYQDRNGQNILTDANGNPVENAVTYTGNIGDKPAPIAKYIPGYVPQAKRVTKTLTSNPEDNQFIFEYVKLEPGTITEYDPITETIIVRLPSGEEVVIPMGTTYETIPGTGAGAGDAANPDGIAAGEPLTTPEGTEVIDEDGNPLAAPVEEVNLDDNENPLASGLGKSGTTAGSEASVSNSSSILPWLIPALIALIIGGVAVFLTLFLLHIRRQEKEAEAHAQNYPRYPNLPR